MALSEKKKNKMKLAKRREEVNARSLNGKGYFMDGSVEPFAKRYLESGDPKDLERLPDYRKFRSS